MLLTETENQPISDETKKKATHAKEVILLEDPEDIVLGSEEFREETGAAVEHKIDGVGGTRLHPFLIFQEKQEQTEGNSCLQKLNRECMDMGKGL